MKKLLLALVLMLIPAVAFSADTKADRERKVKVALALHKTNKTPAATLPVVAPAPKEVAPPVTKKLSYFDGVTKANAANLPLVIFVGCDLEYNTKEAILTKVDFFGSYARPSVLVGYSVGGRLYVEKQLDGKFTLEEVEKAVKDVSKKLLENPLQQMPAAENPLNWQIKANCNCENCTCPPGVCPSCPLPVAACVSGQCNLNRR